MKTIAFGFGSMDRGTHLDIRRSVLQSALAMVSPALVCLLVVAFAFLQPYSAASQSADQMLNPSGNTVSISSDSCEFADLACIQRQSEIQVAQTNFLSRQYPLILKTAQALEEKRASLSNQPSLSVQQRLSELSDRVKIMTTIYNAHASRTEPSLLSERHLPTQLSQ